MQADISLQVYLITLKISVFALIIFIILHDFVYVHYRQPEFALTLIIIPAALLHAYMAAYSVKTELRRIMAGVIVCLALLTFVI